MCCHGTEEIEMTGFDPKPTVKELIKATKFFSEKIGSGSLGEVYEVNLLNQLCSVLVGGREIR